MFNAASEILIEKSKENEFTKRVYDSWSSYWTKATKLSNLTELGYMNLRSNYKKKNEI
jgi:TRAP-type mannitol/chloroaromatic compound transport system substrate-binding protein